MLSSAQSLDSRFALDTQGMEQLKAQARKNPNQALEMVANQFESMFINMMIKSMRDAMPESGLLASDQSKTYQSMMDQQWSQHLSGKGFGIAEQLINQLKVARSAERTMQGLAEDLPIRTTPHTKGSPEQEQANPQPVDSAAKQQQEAAHNKPSGLEQAWFEHLKHQNVRGEG